MSEMIKIPDGWNKSDLGSIIELLTDYTANGSFESLRDNVQYYNSEEYAVLVRTTDLNKRIFKPERFTDYKGWKYLRKTALYGNEILIANVGSVGNVYRVPFYNKAMTLAPNMYLLKFKDEVSEDYLYYVLTSKEFKTNLLKQLGSTTLQAINKDNLRVIEISAPALKQEQQKIAEVLSEIDNAISKVEELFEKNKRIKTALMQDLLNYGIDGNGKIRNPQTHIFKPSELGDIPEEWNCVELGRVCDVRDGTHDSPNYINYGIPFVTSKNLMDTGIDFKNVNYIKEDVHKLISNRSKVENGDILFGMIGTIGKPVIVNTDFEFSIKNVALIKKIKLNFDNIFLLNFLKSNFFNKNVTNIFNGGVQNFISLGMVRKLLILQPEISEQQKIAQILSSQDEKIEDIKNKLNKLKSLKASLMQDLLSGKVRVTKLMEENS